MALEEFEEDPLSHRQKNYLRMRSLMDFCMGALWMAMGIFLLFIKHFDANLALRFDDPTFKMLGAVCVIYGIFRIYRGIKKNYYRER